MLTKEEGNIGWVVEEGDEKSHLGIQDQLQLRTTAYTIHPPGVILLSKIL